MITLADFEKICLIRLVEERLLELFVEGKIKGTTHTCIGQEAVAVGVIGCLDTSKDTVFSTHRGHGHYLASTGDVDGFLRELMGKKGGSCHGLGGSQHLHKDNTYTNGIQGGVPAVATGLAMAHKLNQSGAISTCFMGDGTFGEGLCYEAFNMASLWELPVLYIIEDNSMAQSTPASRNRAGHLSDRLKAFSIQVEEIDGQDISAVREATLKISASIRKNNQPGALVCKTERFGPHSKGDDTRSEKELLDVRKRDPLKICQTSLKLDSQKVESIKKSIQQDLDQLILNIDRETSPPLPQPQAIQKDMSSRAAEFDNSVAGDLNAALHDLCEDKKVILIGEDIDDPYGGAFKITRGCSTNFREQVYTSPISEAGITGIANGLSLQGYKPIVEVMFGDFLFLAADQLLNHACKFQQMYGEDRHHSIVLRTPMGGRRGYGPTHSQSIEKHFLGMPGLCTVAVNSLSSPGSLLKWSVQQARMPVLFIENKTLYGEKPYQLPDEFLLKRELEINGTFLNIVEHEKTTPDLLMVGYGGAGNLILECCKRCHEEEIITSAVIPELIDPLGPKLIEVLIDANRPVLIVEESVQAHGWGAEVVSQLCERGFSLPLLRCGSRRQCIPATKDLENQVLIQEKDIMDAILNLLD